MISGVETSVEKPFDCFLIQNCQAMHSIRRSMDWTVKDDMVNRLLLCAAVTSCRPYPFVQAGVATSETGAEAVNLDPRCSWQGHSRVDTNVGDENTESRGALQPLLIPSVIRQDRCIFVVVVRWTDELFCGGYIPTRWTGEHWVEQMSGLLGTACWRPCGFFVTKFSRLDAREDRKIVSWCRTQA